LGGISEVLPVLLTVEAYPDRFQLLTH
jgi:hypothetical protein